MDETSTGFFLTTTSNNEFLFLFEENITSSGSQRPTVTYYLPEQFPVYSVQVAVAFFGLLTNSINIFIFLKIGIQDSVTAAFFCLSISDILHLATFCIIRLLTILMFEHRIQSSIVRLQDLGGSFGWLSLYFMDVSMYITVYATFQKCCCVVLPLTFKNVFTTRRSLITSVVLFLATLVIFIPVYINIINKWFFDPTTRDRPLDWIKINSSLEATAWRWLNRIILTPTSQVIVIACLILITIKLKQSVKFRMGNSSSGGTMRTQNENKDENETKDDSSQSNKFGQRELRAIQSVQLIAFIFIVATLPSTVNSLTAVLYPAFNHPSNRRTVFTVQALMYFGGTISASVNIFVYLAYNTKYKNAFFQHILRSKPDRKESMKEYSDKQ